MRTHPHILMCRSSHGAFGLALANPRICVAQAKARVAEERGSRHRERPWERRRRQGCGWAVLIYRIRVGYESTKSRDPYHGTFATVSRDMGSLAVGCIPAVVPMWARATAPFHLVRAAWRGPPYGYATLPRRAGRSPSAGARSAGRHRAVLRGRPRGAPGH